MGIERRILLQLSPNLLFLTLQIMWVLTQPCTLQPQCSSFRKGLLLLAPAWMLHGANSLGRSISPKTAVLITLVSGCALLTPGSSKSVAFRWIRDQWHLKNWRGSILQLGCIGCLHKGGFYDTIVLWLREVVNPCERAKHKGDGISWGFLLLTQGETRLSSVYATPSWHSLHGFTDRTMQ